MTWRSETSPLTNRIVCGSAISPTIALMKESCLLCAVEDIFSNRIIGYYIDSRMKSRLAVTAR
ncbi:hypothetical protein [Nocardia sp. AB354]|uniref:hypothetical protein n=1 Tax=Nocardia sp. AB354 TaxID=3413283 RepID=UPI003C1C8D71